MTGTLSQLTPLLSPKPYLLAYTIPLLLISMLLTFSGTFLTLDRSRSFPSTGVGVAATGKVYAALGVPGSFAYEKPKKPFLGRTFEGGIGGLAAGFLFGLHLSTCLALLIPATTPSAALSSKSFVAVWVLSCAVTTPLGGRFRYAAIAFLGISGGTLTAIGLSIMTHPALKSRVILTAIFLPLFTIVVLLAAIIPAPITQSLRYPVLRLCSASTGAFGIVMSIALLLNPQVEGWANAWEHLWLAIEPEIDDWGSGKEQGLTAAYAAFLLAGAAVDWALHRWIGECPDEKWDNYLANYAANLPNRADRAGTFQPSTSFWDRLFGSAPVQKGILFPNDPDFKSSLPMPFPVTSFPSHPGKLSKTSNTKEDEQLERVPTRIDFLKKRSRSKAWMGAGGWKAKSALQGEERKERRLVRFGDVSDSDTEDDEDDVKKAPVSLSASPSPVVGQQHGFRDIKQAKPLLSVFNPSSNHSQTASSSRTAVSGGQVPTSDPRLDAIENLDYDHEIELLKKKRGEDKDDADYSDYEEDLTATRLEDGEEDVGKKWSPGFLKRHQSQIANTPQGTQTKTKLQAPVPVPATPSLIKAIDRLTVAQRGVYGSPDTLSKAQATTKVGRRPSVIPEELEAGLSTIEPEPKQQSQRAPRWEEFWREVRMKAES